MNYRVVAAGVAASALLAFTVHKFYTGSRSRASDAAPPVSKSVAAPENQLPLQDGNVARAITPKAPDNGRTLPREASEAGTGPSSPSELATTTGDTFLRSLFAVALPENSSTTGATPPEGSPDQFNQLMNSESRDEYWAANAETRLEDYLARQPNADKLQPPDVECRATVCRILTAADTATLQLTPNADLSHAMSGFRFESESKEFDASAELMVINPKFPDKVGFALFLHRAQPADPNKP